MEQGDPGHQPVLTHEIVTMLAPKPGDIVVDATIGRGGHAAELARIVTPGGGRIIGFDLDSANLAFARARIEQSGGRIEPFHASFVEIPRYLGQRGIRADILLADLGFSSNQMDNPSRGFSFAAEGPLDMRLNREQPTTAADLIASLPETELAEMIFRYGEEPLSRKIARKLVEARAQMPIRSTTELAQLVVEAYGTRARQSRMHPATRTFMALRIAVNDELAALEALLDSIARCANSAGSWLRPGARIAFLCFHSLEDRLVKQTFRKLASLNAGVLLAKKPVTASEQEIRANPRARSAKLRGIRLNDQDDQSA